MAIANQTGVISFEQVNVTSDKKFKCRPEFGNLCMGRLVSVEIRETTTPTVDDKGVASTYEYAGLEIPTLVFRYQEEKTPADDVDRFYEDSYRIVTTKKNDGQMVDAKTFTNIVMETYRHCRHRLDVYKACPNFVDPGYPQPIDMNASIDDRIKQWRSFCEFFVNAFTKGKDGKPVYLDVNGNSALLWIKLIAHYGDRKYLCAPSFVGEGYMELFVEGKAPSIEIKPGETVELAAKADDEDKPKDNAAAQAGASMGYGAMAGGGVSAQQIADLQNKYAGGMKY